MEIGLHTEREPDAGEIEIVERKGRGHPYTLCDAIAERISVRGSLAVHWHSQP
jgi:S-adenosylmethionine synthetase